MDDHRIDALAARLDRLERENRRWRRAGALAVVGVAVFGGAAAMRPGVVEARQAVAPPAEAADPAALVAEQLQVSRRALRIIDQTEARGARVSNPVDYVTGWSLRELGTRIYLSLGEAEGEPRTQDVEVYLSRTAGAPKAERRAAFQEHVARMRTWEKKFRPLVDNGTLSILDFLELQARRLQAETWLARERRKSDGGPPRAS